MQEAQRIDIDEPLTQAIWQFNFRPDLYVHESWLKSMPEGVIVQRLLAAPSSENRLAHYLLERLGVAESVFFDFRSPLTQIALWSGQDIKKLIEYIGATLYSDLVRLVITRDDIMRLRHSVGEDLYAFMQQRAPTIHHKFGKLPVFPGKLSLQRRMILAGLLCLRASFSRFPEAFWRRLMFKLDRSLYVQWKRYARFGSLWDKEPSECAVLVQRVAVDLKMGVGRDGKILFN